MSELVSQPSPAPVEDLEDLYENAPCGYLSTTPDGAIFKANATLAAWTGYTTQQLIGMKLRDLQTMGSRLFSELHLSPVLAMQGQASDAALDLKTASGATLPMLASAVERRDAQGKLLFIRLTLFKAEERRRYEQQLIEARRQATQELELSRQLEAALQERLAAEQATADLREQFIAVLGHDLRNPLASISGGVRLLAKESLSDRGRLLLDMLQGSVLRMGGLIENVLDLARGRLGGGISLDRQPVLLGPVIEHVVDELRVGATDHAIETDIWLPVPVSCDRSRIGQLVSNLLGNALTHGSRSEPVRLRAFVQDGNFELSVANGGAPIPQAARAKLFQPFFRGEVRASKQGLGLGLHIASEIAKAHDGTLDVFSDETETRFTFRMPLNPDDKAGP